MRHLSLAYDLTNAVVQIAIVFGFGFAILSILSEQALLIQIIMGLLSLVLLVLAVVIGSFAVHSLFNRLLPEEERAEFWVQKEQQAREDAKSGF